MRLSGASCSLLLSTITKPLASPACCNFAGRSSRFPSSLRPFRNFLRSAGRCSLDSGESVIPFAYRAVFSTCLFRRNGKRGGQDGNRGKCRIVGTISRKNLIVLHRAKREWSNARETCSRDHGQGELQGLGDVKRGAEYSRHVVSSTPFSILFHSFLPSCWSAFIHHLSRSNFVLLFLSLGPNFPRRFQLACPAPLVDTNTNFLVQTFVIYLTR